MRAARHLLFCLFSFTFGAHLAWGQIAHTPDQPDFECPVGAPPWSCYGSMEIFIGLELQAPDKTLPMFRRQVLRFANREVLIESEDLGGGRHGERKLKTYFVARPSAVALASGWDTWQNPMQEAGHVIEELRNVCEILRAGFPNGPEALTNDWQTVTATVKETIYPIGEQLTQKTVTARKDHDGGVHFFYRGVGEPIGPYQVTGVWSATKPAPQRDDSPVPYSGTQPGFKMLGQMRAYEGDSRKNSTAPL